MALKDWFDPEPQQPALRSGPVRVGWVLNEKRSGVVYYPPERIRSVEVNRTHAKSASRCPAIINMESRYFLIRVPYDLHLRFARDDKGKPGLRNMTGEASPVRSKRVEQKTAPNVRKRMALRRSPNCPNCAALCVLGR